MMDMYANKYTSAKVLDGTSHTLHVGETHWADYDANEPGCFTRMQWMATFGVSTTVWGINTDYVATLGFSKDENEYYNYLTGCNFRSRHPGGAYFLYVDGSVRFLNDDISDALLANLGDRKDGRIGAEYTRPGGGVIR